MGGGGAEVGGGGDDRVFDERERERERENGYAGDGQLHGLKSMRSIKST